MGFSNLAVLAFSNLAPRARGGAGRGNLSTGYAHPPQFLHGDSYACSNAASVVLRFKCERDEAFI